MWCSAQKYHWLVTPGAWLGDLQWGSWLQCSLQLGRCLFGTVHIGGVQNQDLLCHRQMLYLLSYFCLTLKYDIYLAHCWHTSATMLAIKRSSGVAPELNLRHSLHTGDKAHNWGNPAWLRCPKHWYRWPYRKKLVSYNFFLKNILKDH